MALERIGAGEFIVGQKLSYPVYDDSGKLLLKKGARIASHSQLTSLIERGLYRSTTMAPEPESQLETPARQKEFAFDTLKDISQRLPLMFEALTSAKPGACDILHRITSDIQRACMSNPDEVLATIHLCHDSKYTVYHPIQQAILCEIVAADMGLSVDTRLSIISAALTANISILEMQERFHSQQDALSEEQREVINNHSAESARILREAGVTDSTLLDAVMQHHENVNGQGYPQGFEGEQISEAAAILAVADRYSAMVSGRAYRKPLTAQDALRKFFMHRDGVFHEEIALRFIKELGIYPPGSFVKLENGETAIVTRRGKQDRMAPMVCSFMDPNGGMYIKPRKRDSTMSQYRIKQSCMYDEYDKLNCRMLWNFQE